MASWFSATELQGLPGLPKGRAGIRNLAKRKSWVSRPRLDRGGGQEYHIDSLPSEAQAELRKQSLGSEPKAATPHQIPQEVAVSSSPAGEAGDVLSVSAREDAPVSSLAVPTDSLQVAAKAGAGVPPALAPDSKNQWLEIARDSDRPKGSKQEQRMQARILILSAQGPWCERQGITKRLDCGNAYAKAYNQRLLGFPGWIYEVVKSISWATLHNWRKQQTDQVTGLRGNYQRQKGGMIGQDTQVRETLHAALGYLGPVAGVANTLRVLRAELPKEKLPSYQQLQRYLLRLRQEDAATWLKLTNPKAYKNSL